MYFTVAPVVGGTAGSPSSMATNRTPPHRHGPGNSSWRFSRRRRAAGARREVARRGIPFGPVGWARSRGPIEGRIEGVREMGLDLRKVAHFVAVAEERSMT